ncbi:MAG: cupin domain-containing protein [Candidatus Thermoplasmatota archaeon]|nr:cupin domain-containing protein [Candidatus Thermoplasmatota archaeon]
MRKMNDEPIYVKRGEQQHQTKTPGKLFRLMIKSEKLEAIIAEIDPHTTSRWYQHDGEELHYVLEGEIEYEVGEKTYRLSTGELLWHKSTIKHRANNTSDKKAKYATIGTPPTFM